MVLGWSSKTLCYQHSHGITRTVAWLLCRSILGPFVGSDARALLDRMRL